MPPLGPLGQQPGSGNVTPVTLVLSHSMRVDRGCPGGGRSPPLAPPEGPLSLAPPLLIEEAGWTAKTAALVARLGGQFHEEESCRNSFAG